VATFLVGRGELLRAQQRLGHRDPSTTLRNYAHALPLEDEAVADDLDELLYVSPVRWGGLRPVAQASAGLVAPPQETSTSEQR